MISRQKTPWSTFTQRSVVSAPLEPLFRPCLSQLLDIVKNSLDRFPVPLSPKGDSQPMVMEIEEYAYYIKTTNQLTLEVELRKGGPV